MRVFTAFAVAVASLGLSMVALDAVAQPAQPPPPAQPAPQNEAEIAAQASELNQQAEAAFSAGDFKKAAELLQQAYNLTKGTSVFDPVLMFNIGKTHEKRAEAATDTAETIAALDDAIRAYGEYLEVSQAISDRDSVRRTKEALQKKRDELAGVQRPLPPGPGPAPTQPGRSPSWGPYAVMGTGALLIAGGGYFGLRVKHHNDEAVKACNAGTGDTCNQDPITGAGLTQDEQSAVRGHLDDAKRSQWLQFGGYGLGGAALVGGAVWWYLDRKAVRESRVVLQVGPGSFGIAGKF